MISYDDSKASYNYTIKPLDLGVRCLFKDGYEVDCLDCAEVVLVIDFISIPMCIRHLHIKMNALIDIAIRKSNVVITLNVG